MHDGRTASARDLRRLELEMVKLGGQIGCLIVIALVFFLASFNAVLRAAFDISVI